MSPDLNFRQGPHSKPDECDHWDQQQLWACRSPGGLAGHGVLMIFKTEKCFGSHEEPVDGLELSPEMQLESTLCLPCLPGCDLEPLTRRLCMGRRRLTFSGTDRHSLSADVRLPQNQNLGGSVGKWNFGPWPFHGRPCGSGNPAFGHFPSSQRYG